MKYSNIQEEIKNGLENIVIEQGNIGNCWFLSTVGALLNKEDGRERLLELVTVDDENKCVEVKFKSLGGKSYKIPFEQLETATEFNSSSYFVRALEIASERYLLEQGSALDWVKANANGDSIRSPYDGGTSGYALAIMFSENVSPTNYISDSMTDQVFNYLGEEIGEEFIPYFKDYLGVDASSSKSYEYYHDINTIKEALNNGSIITVIRSEMVNDDNVKPGNSNGAIHNPADNHVMFVSRISDDNKYIYVKDPHNTGIEYKYTVEEFANSFPLVDINSINNFQSINFNDNKILTVCSSGDQAFNLILNGASKVDLFDINGFTKYYFYLKKAAIMGLNYQDFMTFFFSTLINKQSFSFNSYLNFRDLIDDFDARIFWDYLFCHYNGNDIYKSKLFHKLYYSKKDTLKRNQYLHY
jgi:hypothetical protein